MKKAIKKSLSVMTTFMMVLALAMCFIPTTVKAAGEKVSFGSDYYEPEKKGNFRIGVYIESAENMGNYEVYLSYDPTKLEYISGATSSGEGTIAITETCNDTNKKYLLTFKPLMACSTYLKVDNATIYDKATGTPTVVEDLPYVNIFVGGDNSTALTQLSVNGSEVEGLTGRVFDYTVIVPYAEDMEISSWDDVTLETSVDSLQEGINDLELKVSAADGSVTMYNLTVDMGPAPVVEEPVVEQPIEQQVTEEVATTENETSDGKMVLFDRDSLSLVIIALILLILVILAATVLIVVTNRALNVRAKRERMMLKTKIEAARLGIDVDVDLDEYEEDDEDEDEDYEDEDFDDEEYDEDEDIDEDEEVDEDEEEVDE